MKMIGIVLLLVASSALVFAGEYDPAPVPEIDAASAASAFCLVSGAVLVFRARRKQ